MPLHNNHLMPLDTISGYQVRPGLYDGYGARLIPNGVSFTLRSQRATSCELLLYHHSDNEPYARLRIPDSYRIGDVYSITVFGLDADDLEYTFSVDGPFVPDEGLIYDKTKYLLDPYAKAVTGQGTWGSKPDSGFQYRARVVSDSFDWGDSQKPELPMEDLVLYELHVRGFTKDPSSGVSAPGTFAGAMEKIPYLKSLGINAVELMPVFEFDEVHDCREVDGKMLLEYWGYNPVSFFSPNSNYASDREDGHSGTELKSLVKAFHEQGIEVYIDTVFNHTAEGNEHGNYFSFKGIDNQIYYMLTPDGYYYNISGCGNTLNYHHPLVRQMILDCLRYWATDYRIDGFRLDLSALVGRGEDGAPLSRPSLLETLAHDPILGRVKWISEAWDTGGLYQADRLPSWNRFAEWNTRYRDDMRSFLKGDEHRVYAAVSRITGSPDLYPPKKRCYNPSINFLSCHDGFTLYDLYSYNEKHNECNGWNNTDGENNNRSWNCGAEGETDDPLVLALRYRMIENAAAVLMCSRGIPLFFAGDEFGNTQFGNNNAYCQDNPISWLDWKLLHRNKQLYEFFRYMIALRRAHPAISRDTPLCSIGFPPFSIHSTAPSKGDAASSSRVFGITFAGTQPDGRDDIIYLAMNVYWEEVEIGLPALYQGMYWSLLADTGRYPASIPDGTGGWDEIYTDHITLKPRSIAVLTATTACWRR